MSAEPQAVPQASACAFNQDASLCAIALNSEEISIYKTGGSEDVTKWEKKYTLREHGGWVAALDWCHSTNMIASCGHDRNAYVWKYVKESDEWKPTLVILRINRAATCVKWSAAGTKFAVGSGAKCVPVCNYEQSNDWWVSKMIKKHKSTVLSLAWCCNNKFIVTGSSDYKCRILSAYLKDIDSAEDDGFGDVFGKNVNEFGECLAEFDMARSWVNAVAWSPGGFRVAFAGHGSTITFVQLLAANGDTPAKSATGVECKITTVSHKGLPFLDVAFLTDNTVVAVGYDNTPTTFTVQGGSATDPQWALGEQFDKSGTDAKTGGNAPPKTPTGAATGGASAARAMFQNQASKGVPAPAAKPGAPAAAGAAAAKPALVTRHQNAITNVLPLPDANNAFTKIWTSSLDGRVLAWDLPKLKIKVVE